MHKSIVHTENCFRGVPVAVAYRGKRSDQSTTMFSGTSALSPFNKERRRPTLAAFTKKQDSGFRKHRFNIDIHAPLAVVTFVWFPIYSLPFATSWIYILPTPKLMTLLNSVYHSIRSSEVGMLCFHSVMLVRSFTANKISGTRHQPLLHAIRNIFVFVSVLPPIEMICNMCCPTSDIHSTVVLEYAMLSSAREKIPSDPVAGRVRGMVVGQGSYKQKTLSVTRNRVG